MVKVELIKGLSYRGHGVNAIKGIPLTVNEEKAVTLVDTGFFEYVGENNTLTVSVQNLGLITPEDIEKMKLPQLTDFAEAKGIDISSCKNNKERIEVIKGWLENQSVCNFGDATPEDIEKMSELELIALAEQENKEERT